MGEFGWPPGVIDSNIEDLIVVHWIQCPDQMASALSLKADVSISLFTQMLN